MDKLDQKTMNKMINAIEGAKEYTRHLQVKREEKLWKEIETPCQLIDFLRLLTKDELDEIRKQLKLKGMSSLKKGELAGELSRSIPFHFKQVLFTLDQERTDLIQQIIKNSGTLLLSDEYPISKITTMRRLGIIFPVIKDGQKLLMMPLELIEQFAEVDRVEFQDKILINTEWIRLTHGMLYYYGVMDSSEMLDRISALSKREVDIVEYFDVISSASDYYVQIRNSISSYGGYMENRCIFNAKNLIEVHKTRTDINYYPFTKKQLLKAGTPGFIDKTPEMEKFLRFLSNSYDLTVQEKNEIAYQFLYMINSDAHPSMLIEYLQSKLEFPSFEFVQQLTAFIMEVHNHTRMWSLKGYSPTELRKKEERHLQPLPSSTYHQTQNRSNVIDFRDRIKIRRNDPCPCGSGNKYKKCCGKQ
ncbi:YecA family protein [Peribacillus alkalitolerans]|uniref:YecA family protein n=1 Tax=Peribacillus alkalitolerans TaxID=1550385 RepID=UPI0013D4E0DB|nr:SEC-C metal-binding domain-containing protein [Peribacillus alkalitolerans]